MKLQHRIALVTGSSSGIGRGVALAFAAQGAEVVINDPSAAELASATQVAPGATRTPMLDAVPPAVLEAIRSAIPLGRLAEVADMVPSYVFLASEDARHDQGQCLSPNGGDVFL
jgi:3-oxoacyl-[acyl-carrier protein] reductase